jgi:hypothetical protein
VLYIWQDAIHPEGLQRGVEVGLLQSDVNSEDEEAKKGRALTAKKHTRARAASLSAEKAEPRPKRQKQTKKAGGKTKLVEPTLASNAKVANPTHQMTRGYCMDRACTGNLSRWRTSRKEIENQKIVQC